MKLLALKQERERNAGFRKFQALIEDRSPPPKRTWGAVDFYKQKKKTDGDVRLRRRVASGPERLRCCLPS
jgi:hypothetical protein